MKGFTVAIPALCSRHIQVSQQKKNVCDDELHSSQSCPTYAISLIRGQFHTLSMLHHDFDPNDLKL